ncbi:MAG: capsule assembly Wzi family protein [Candidatus Sulfotelmatobacter sp.]
MTTMCLLAGATFAIGQTVESSPPANRGLSVAPNEPAQAVQPGEAAQAGLPDNPSAPDDDPANSTNQLLNLPRHLLHDQFGMWTSLRKIQLSDATWLVPLGGFTAALLSTDSDVSRHLSNDPNTLLRYRHFSDYGAYSMVGGAGALYLWGLTTKNEHQRETGYLSGEAAIDSLIVVEALKYATRRQRPYQDGGSGQFWHGGTSFPSEHSAVAWSIAGTIAHEYPSPLMRFLAYGAATAISASRITAKQHFPSDVLVGMALGYLTSEYVYRQHHNPDLSGSNWEMPAVRQDRPSHWRAKNMGSPYVPLDSWVYPAMDRLTALGYIHSGFADMRPWTRMECARQVEEASDRITENDALESEDARLYQALQKEFENEVVWLGGGNNADFRVESVYARSTEIAGKPLTDSDHFGQTVINDFGRPEEQGFNNVSGLSGWASDGPFAVYARGEFQHSPSASALPLTARDAISQADFSHSLVPAPFPVPPDTPTQGFDQGRFLDTYVAMNLSDWQLSYGNQSLWWGPEQGGPLMFSDNAEPVRMFRVNRVTPFTLPSFLGVFGPIRLEAFVGQFSGYQFVFAPSGLFGQYGQSLNPQPIIHGERISFKPTSNLEIGLSRTTDYGGPGYPLTIHTFLRSLFSTSNSLPGAPNKPGSRRSGLDFTYRVPGVRDGLTFYADGLAEHDEITPLLGPDVASWVAGIYLPRLPRIPKMDIRFEGGYTDPPPSGFDVAFGAFYWDATWITGFQNASHLMGSWIGRQGQGAQAWTTYWFTPRNKLQFGYRHQKVSHEFIPAGGTLTDASVRGEFCLRSSFSLSASVQYEVWNFPVIAAASQSNVTSSLQLSFWPGSFRKKSASQ